MHPRQVILAVFCLVALVSCSDDKVIYGNDDRTEPYSITDTDLLNLVQADVAIMYASQLSKSGSSYKLEEYAPYNGIQCPNTYVDFCSTEPFLGQLEAAFCSGFLIRNDANSSRIVTAGHCLNGMDCGSMAFVFDYKMSSSTSMSKSFPSSNVYFCHKYYYELDSSSNMDFGVVELDRKVSGRTALPYRMNGTITTNDNLVMVGHPSGLPMKVAGGAEVKSVGAVRFEANTDSYAGNSGSMVVNSDTWEVEGILVEGNQDFVVSGGCCVSNKCSDTLGCAGTFEIMSKISQASPYFYADLPYDDGWTMQPIMMLVVVLALLAL